MSRTGTDSRSDARIGVGIVGAGSWGTALAVQFARRGAAVTLWAREPEVVDGIRGEHRNPLFLSEVELPPAIAASGDLDEVVGDADVLVTAVPVQHSRATLEQARLGRCETVVTVSKGIEAGTLATPHEILVDLGAAVEHIVVVSGPSFARGVAEGRPTAVVAAGADDDRTRRVQELLSGERFRVYTSDDVVGVEIGGALKNVVALAAGVSDGLGLGDNARAAIITRGLAEITRLGVALGGHPATFAGLSGVGDLVLTCAGGLSRNRSVGLALGAGGTLAEITSEMHEVAEGVPTCRSARDLAQRVGVELPITEQMYLVLYDGKSPRDALRDLLERNLRHERESHGRH